MIGVNNDHLMTFRNQAASNRKPFSVRLRGRPGNPTGVGARVTVRLADGSSQTAELYAGGGYLSQSPASLTFGLGDSGKVAQIAVIWPDGKITTMDAPSGSSAIIEQPE